MTSFKGSGQVLHNLKRRKPTHPEENGKPIRNYRFFRSSWLFITLFVFLALICTLIISLVFIGIVQSLGAFAVTITLDGSPVIAFILVTIIIGTILSMVFARVIVIPINKLRNATRRVASGDFTVQLPVTSNSDIAQLTNDFNQMVRELGSTETLRNDFIANVSHEFKTPISAIEGFADLLQNENVTEEERREYASFISESAKKLSILTSNILRLSKLENQEFSGDQTTFSLDEQIRRCILVFEKEWTAKNLELDIELESAIVTNCEELLDQVWLNIIGNAIKFTDDGGKITIKLSVDSECIVSIKDTGVGMSKEVMEHIFDKFYQADGSRSNQGNGLGLALVKQILDLVGGKIKVESQPGVGSEFIVTLPMYS